MFFLKHWQLWSQHKGLFGGALASTVPRDGDPYPAPTTRRGSESSSSALANRPRTACLRSLAMTRAGDHAGVAIAGPNSDIGVDFLLSFARGRHRSRGGDGSVYRNVGLLSKGGDVRQDRLADNLRDGGDGPALPGLNR